jgi:hypothetical protein
MFWAQGSFVRPESSVLLLSEISLLLSRDSAGVAWHSELWLSCPSATPAAQLAPLLLMCCNAPPSRPLGMACW